MKKLISIASSMLIGVMSLMSQTPVEVSGLQDIQNACKDLTAGTVSSESFKITKPITVLGAGTDLMFVRDATYKCFAIANESETVQGQFKTFAPGKQLRDVVIRYQDRNGLPYGIYREETLPEVSGNVTVSYTSVFNLASSSMTYPAAYATGSLKQMAGTVDKKEGVVNIDYIRQGKDAVATIHAKEMGIDVSGMLDGEYLFNVKGIYLATDAGCDIYPIELKQLVPETIDNIAALLKRAEDENLSGQSDVEYILKSRITVLAVSKQEMYIQDESGAMLVKAGKITGTNTYTYFDASGYKQGDQFVNFPLYVNRTTGYATSLNGVFCNSTFPKPDGNITVVPESVTMQQLKDGGAKYECRLIKLENVVIKNNMYEGTSFHTAWNENFYPDAHTIYTVVGIYSMAHSVIILSMQKTGEIPPLVPVEVADINAFMEKALTAEFDTSGISKDIYQISGDVTVITKTGSRTMFIEDKSGAIPVTALASNVSASNYDFGTVIGGFKVKLNKSGNRLMALFDPDEATWPEGRTSMPEAKVVSLENLNAEDSYFYISINAAEMASANNFKAPQLRTASNPTAAASVVCQRSTINAGSISSMAKGKKYDMTGVLYPYSINTEGEVSSWYFYVRTATETVEPQIIECEGVADLKSKLSQLAVGATSYDSYKLGVAQVTAVTESTMFVQTTGDDDVVSGLGIVPAGATADFSACKYELGQLVDALTGKVTNVDGRLVMNVDASALPGSTLKLAVEPLVIKLDELKQNNAYQDIYVKIEGVSVTVSETKSVNYEFDGIGIVDGLVNAQPVELKSAFYDLSGVYDGKDFYLLNATEADKTGIDTTEADGIYINGDSVSVPEGSVVFDVQGRKTDTNHLQPGIYIITTPSKTVKIKI